MRPDGPPPAPGLVAVSLQGRPEDIRVLLAAIRAAVTVWDSPAYVYADRNGITVRRYLTADLRAEEPSGPRGSSPP